MYITVCTLLRFASLLVKIVLVCTHLFLLKTRNEGWIVWMTIHRFSERGPFLYSGGSGIPKIQPMKLIELWYLSPVVFYNERAIYSLYIFGDILSLYLRRSSTITIPSQHNCCCRVYILYIVIPRSIEESYSASIY